MRIVRATAGHIDQVAVLFDRYRQFYDCAPDIKTANCFITDRITSGESIIFLAEDEAALGFVQMYPSFCSVDAIRILILYDLYVDELARGKGIGEALMNRASEYAHSSGIKRIDLQTAKDNSRAQALYKKLGYRRENDDFLTYSLRVPG
jgi:ribosomal protein S18 acetylase RimI-like enzyme